METEIKGSESGLAATRENPASCINKSEVREARSYPESLERSYQKSSRILQSMALALVFAVMVVLAYSLFGGRVDREKFTTDVTPIHVELNPISGRRETAQNLRNIQM